MKLIVILLFLNNFQIFRGLLDISYSYSINIIFKLFIDIYDSRVLNTLFRVCFGLFFLFVIWLVQPNRNNVDDKIKRD